MNLKYTKRSANNNVGFLNKKSNQCVVGMPSGAICRAIQRRCSGNTVSSFISPNPTPSLPVDFSGKTHEYSELYPLYTDLSASYGVLYSSLKTNMLDSQIQSKLVFFDERLRLPLLLINIWNSYGL